MTRSFGLIAYIWKGESATPPANPAQNWVYRNSTNKSVYMYDSGAWVLMTKDGIDGVSPHIDPTTKHWFIGTIDTGVAAEGSADIQSISNAEIQAILNNL